MVRSKGWGKGWGKEREKTRGKGQGRKQLGQGMTEYIIIVALIAVAAIAVYQLFGQVIRSQTAAMVQEIAGEDGSAESQAAQGAASTAKAQAAARSLKSFTGNAALGGAQ